MSSLVFRRTCLLLARPKGPLGQRVGGEYRVTMPYRTEQTMARTMNKHPGLNANIREVFKKPMRYNNIKAIPRDLGELPRNYVVKILLLNQPIRLQDLWELCKQRDDIPLDSAKHLRQVLKIAKVQKWVYTEKNQTNNMWYYYIHESRVNEVQEMVRQDAALGKEEEARKADVAEEERAAEQAVRAETIDDTIQLLQNALVSNVTKIAEFDPTFVRSLPYVTESGSVDVAWHWERPTPKAPQLEN